VEVRHVLQDPTVIPVDDATRAGEVRRAAVALAAAIGFGEADQGRVALAATEAATNLVKHASGGEVVLRSLSAAEGGGLELLALDRGPGMADPGQCLRDGFSTAGTSGAGLGAIRRMSDLFDITSAPGSGTVLVARFGERAAAPVTPPPCEVGAVCLPVAGEEACGDGWAVETSPDRTAILVVDGLGHGLPAARAAAEAVRVFRPAAPRSEPADLLPMLHAALRPTRGAAAAVAVIERVTRTLRFAGVGNIGGTILGPARRQGLVCVSGTLGHELRKVQSFDYPWPDGGQLILFSDGLGSQWDLARYPGLAGRHPAVIAGVLYRDFCRGRDDVTVLAVRDTETTPAIP
jgi:anti-sigma regulatory factor (Ser/Thr protein kinase)